LIQYSNLSTSENYLSEFDRKMKIATIIFILKCVFTIVVLVDSKKTGTKDALLVIDVQNCFLTGGSLPVAGGENVIPVINQLRQKFEVVAFTRDWHCQQHVSFASMHEGLEPFDEISLNYDKSGKLCKTPSTNISERVCTEDDIEYRVQQQVFVDHCIMNTPDAALTSKLETKDSQDIFVNKGNICDVDSYSAFHNNGGFGNTEMEEELDKKDVGRIYVVGIALDYCVWYSAKDSQKLGYETFVVKDATRGINSNRIEQALDDMKEAGINIINSDVLINSGVVMKHSFMFILFGILLSTLNHFLSLYA